MIVKEVDAIAIRANISVEREKTIHMYEKLGYLIKGFMFKDFSSLYDFFG